MQTDDHDTAAAQQETPTARPVREPTRVQREKRRFSWIWLVPIVALVVGASVLVRHWMNTGPVITVSFIAAEGIQAGQTELRYKDVVIGNVTGVSVAPDRKQVLVHIQLHKEGADYITQAESKFWVVRPRLGISGVSGLGTILSGAFISVDAPSKLDTKADPVTSFVGVEVPPEISSSSPGARFSLLAPELGSLEIGSPVYFREINVGQVLGYSLDDQGRGVNIQVFINAPNDRFVTQASRFWNVSGINMSFNADGFAVNTASLISMLSGGVAFSMGDEENAPRAQSGDEFVLFSGEAQAQARPDGEPFELEFHFYQSVRGLKVGASIDFQGMELGRVTSIEMDLDADRRRFYTVVRGDIYPMRLGSVYEHIKKNLAGDDEPVRDFISTLVKNGLRAQMQTANLLTGQQFIALDFFPGVDTVEFNEHSTPLEIPVIKGDFDRLQQQILSIVNKIEALPLDETVKSLNASLRQLTGLTKRLENGLVPVAADTLRAAQQALERANTLLSENSPVTGGVEQLMLEMNRTLRSVNGLVEELQSQPSSLWRGRAADKLPESR
ncbi:intermembrane transport protein PqiB [Paenalcaligenes sp. Me131]|uniref:PqiB family protein n=1 Tax=Paenalcaligenes sp. Me131 TaxID=3392636 RepID=UPI003D28564F